MKKPDPKHSKISLFSSIFGEVIDQIADNVMITDTEAVIQYVNPAFERTTGYASKEVIGKNPRLLKSNKQSSQYYKNLWTTILAGKIFYAQTINKNKSGKLYIADQTVSPIKDKNGKIRYFVSVWKDITPRVEAEERIKNLNDYLRFERFKLEQILDFDERISSIKEFHDLIDFIIKKSCDILESERCSLMLMNDQSGELCIKGSIGLDEKIVKMCMLKTGDGIAGKVAREKMPFLVKNIETDERFKRENLPGYKTKSFISLPINLNEKLVGVLNITDKNSAQGRVYTELDLKILQAIVRQAAVAIENAMMYRELKYLTITDPLTGLYNFRYFSDFLELEIKRMHRTLRPLSLMMIDIDEFKLYNDTYGHLEGDQLLKEFAKTFRRSIREIDILCRYAGDEFVIVLPETDSESGRIVGERILENIRHLKLNRPMSISIGIVQCDQKMDRRHLILKADQALYQAKKEGKNRMCVLS